MIVASAWGVKVEWVGGNTLLISDRIPKVDIRWWQGFLSWNLHGVAIRRVALATSDITKMVNFVASDTRLVRWCFAAYYVLDYSLNRRLGRATGYYIEKTLKLPQPR